MCVTINQILKKPNPATNYRITFHLCAYLKLAFPVILNFTKIKIKNYRNCFLFYLNCSFSSCIMKILGKNQEVESGIILLHIYK